MDHCGEHIEFPREALGAAVACPHCQQATTLVEMPPEMVAAPERSEITAAELQEAITGTVTPARASFLYQTGLLLAAIFMVLLPIVYFATVAAFGHATWWYAIHAQGLVADSAGVLYVYLVRICLHIGPLVAGAIAAFFMLKPVRAVAARMQTYITIKDVKKPWGHGQEDVFPASQFEKLWVNMTSLPEVKSRFVVVPRPRGQQLNPKSEIGRADLP